MENAMTALEVAEKLVPTTPVASSYLKVIMRTVVLGLKAVKSLDEQDKVYQLAMRTYRLAIAIDTATKDKWDILGEVIKSRLEEINRTVTQIGEFFHNYEKHKSRWGVFKKKGSDSEAAAMFISILDQELYHFKLIISTASHEVLKRLALQPPSQPPPTIHHHEQEQQRAHAPDSPESAPTVIDYFDLTAHKSTLTVFDFFENQPSTPSSSSSSSQASTSEYDFRQLYVFLGGEVHKEHNTRDWSKYIAKEGEFCIGGGRFGDVYKAKWKDLPSCVSEPPQAVIKVIRPISASQKDGRRGNKVLTYLKREIAVWQDLQHENVVPFIGVCFNFGNLPALTSMYMGNGTVNHYLEDHPDTDRQSVNFGIASGLEYLHRQRPEIIHGDLKAVNILVDSEGRPRLTDFGLSRVVDDSTMWVTTSTSAQGSIRWMAPELLSGAQTTVHAPSDVYAFAMTLLEVMTGKVPFSQYSKDGAVMSAVVMRHERPDCVSGALWDLWKRCWAEGPDDRPRMSEIVILLKKSE